MKKGLIYNKFQSTGHLRVFDLFAFFDLIWYAKIISFDFTGTFAGTLWPIYSDIHPTFTPSFYNLQARLEAHLQSHFMLQHNFDNLFLAVSCNKLFCQSKEKAMNYHKRRDGLASSFIAEHIICFLFTLSKINGC